VTAPPTIPEATGVPVESFDEEPTPRDVPRLAQGSGNERPVTGRVERYSLDDVRSAMGVGVGVDMTNTEWAQRLEQRMADTEERATHAEQAAHAGHEECRTVRQTMTRIKQVVYGGAGILGVTAIAVLKLAFASGEKSSEAKRRDEERVEMRADLRSIKEIVLPELRVLIAANTAAIAGLRGALEQISRLGAVRVQGPPVQPLLPAGGGE
jgi:hypothetical protein